MGIGVASSAQTTDAIQSQDTNLAGIVGDIVQCKRKDGVLTIRLRLRNASGADASVPIIAGRNVDDYYVTAGEKKYFVLRDSEKVPLSPQYDGSGRLTVSIPKGASYTWWAKYPAPPSDVTSITYYTPLGPPYEDVPITD
jgi:hypothetical protein